ncbi:MAG: phosphate/phosphite/phosphonate ABC transporter substrate-binding protein [Pseudomonadota bacterium]
MRFRAALTLLLITFAAASPAWAEQRVLVMGAVHDDPNSKYAQMRPIADHVQAALADRGIDSVEVLIVPDQSQMISLLRDGRIDWVSETPYTAAYLQRRANAEFLARRWKDGNATYRSVFFARKDSGINSLDDLKNRIVAFEHRRSTSGFFLPASMMNALELPLDSLATPRETPRLDTYGYVYSGNEYNSAMWVHKRLVDAGALSDSDWQNPAFFPAQFHDDMRVIATSDELPRGVELVRSGLDPTLKRALRDTLFGLRDAPEATAALLAYDQTAQFDALSDECLAALASIGEQLASFGEQFP